MPQTDLIVNCYETLQQHDTEHRRCRQRCLRRCRPRLDPSHAPRCALSHAAVAHDHWQAAAARGTRPQRVPRTHARSRARSLARFHAPNARSHACTHACSLARAHTRTCSHARWPHACSGNEDTNGHAGNGAQVRAGDFAAAAVSRCDCTLAAQGVATEPTTPLEQVCPPHTDSMHSAARHGAARHSTALHRIASHRTYRQMGTCMDTHHAMP